MMKTVARLKGEISACPVLKTSRRVNTASFRHNDLLPIQGYFPLRTTGLFSSLSLVEICSTPLSAEKANPPYFSLFILRRTYLATFPGRARQKESKSSKLLDTYYQVGNHGSIYLLQDSKV